MMTEVKPWEPVSYNWEFTGPGPFIGYTDWPFADGEVCTGINDWWAAHVTLANSQRVIVRALSEERKSARRLQRKIDARVNAEAGVFQ